MTTVSQALTLAMKHFRAGNLQAAAAVYQQVLQVEPQQPDALHFLGAIALQQGRADLAVEYMKQSIDVVPSHAGLHYNLGLAYQALGKLDLAVASYRQALQLNPEWNDALACLATVLSEQGKPDEAVASLQQAVQLSPTAWLQIALATRLPVIYQSVAEVESWRARLIEGVRQLREQQVVHDLTEQTALNLFYLPYQGRDDRDILCEVARLYRAPDLGHEPPQTLPVKSGKVRVGFLSSFFRNHTIGHWMRGLIANLSRESFEVTVLSTGRSQDSIATFIQHHADRYLEVPRYLPAARELIADQHLDVLLYADIGMGQLTYTLAFSRLAPVQCVTVGHPVTTGITTVDYFISSEALENAEADQHYSEKLVRLKHLPVYYYRPEMPVPPKDRSYFGFAAEEHIYVCPQTLFKFHPDFDAILGGILGADPRGVVVLCQGTVPHWEQLLRKRFAATLPDVADRIRFHPYQPYADFVNMLAAADVQLDTLHFGGGHTSYDGLTVGTPIVTLPSQFLRGRITLALYEQMQVLDCLAHNPQQYIEIALRLGTDPDYRQAIRHKILAANSVLFENSEGIRDLEQFLLQAVQASSQKEKA